WDASGTRLVTACADKTARLWDVPTHTLIAQPMSHQNKVASARFNPDGTLVVTVSDDGTARLWDGRTGRPCSEPLRLAGGPGDARFTADGRHVEVALEDNGIRIFKLARSFMRTTPEAGDPPVESIAYPRGVRVVLSGNTVELRRFGGRTLQLVHESTVNYVCFSPDERRLATSTAGKRAR